MFGNAPRATDGDACNYPHAIKQVADHADSRPPLGDGPVALRRNRDFQILWLAQVTSEVGTAVSSVAYPLLVLALTHSAARAGVVGFAASLPWFLFSLPAGALVDRFDRKRVMLTCEACRAFALGSIAVALAIHQLHFVQIAVVAFVETSFAIPFFVSERAALRQVVAEGQLGDAVSQNQARAFAGGLVGPPLGGFLFGLGRGVPFLTDAVSYIVSFVGVAAVRTNLRASGVRPRGRLDREIVEGMRWLWGQPFLRATSLLAASINPLWAAVVLYIVVVSRLHGASASAVGVMMAIVGGGGLIGAFLAPSMRRRLDPRIILLGEPWLAAVLVPLTALTANAYALGAIVAAMISFAPTWEATVVGYRLSIVPDHLQGRVQSVAVFTSHTADALGPLAAGLLIASFGSKLTALVLGGWALSVALVGTATPVLRGAAELRRTTENVAQRSPSQR